MEKKMLMAIVAFWFVGLSSQQSPNVIFEIADLTVDYPTGSGSVTLEAFKSSINDAIIGNKTTDKYGQLTWLSIGFPNLIKTINQKNNKSYLFTFRPEGFDVNVEMLTDEYRNLFRNLVKRKYNIDIELNQIVSLIPSSFDCNLIFYKEEKKILIQGSVNQLTRLPFKLSFLAPINSNERILFQERLDNDKKRLNIEMFCEIAAQGKILRQNKLTISGEQINQIGLAEDIFGPASEIYVTRNQVSDISSNLYQSLNIIEEYEIPETTFKEGFIDDFIKQTASSISQFIGIDEALNKLSRYNYRDDIKPDVIKKDLGKLFYINSTGSKSYLQMNSSHYNKIAIDVQGSFGAKFLNSIGSANSALRLKPEWEKKGTEFSEQLNELNSYAENDIEWERSGNMVVPKSIKVSKLIKDKFRKELVFSRVYKKYYDAPFKRKFILETFNVFRTNEDRHDQNLVTLENWLRLMNTSMVKINKTVNDNKNSALSHSRNMAHISNDILTLKRQHSNDVNNLNSKIKNTLYSQGFKYNYNNGCETQCVSRWFFGCRERRNIIKTSSKTFYYGRSFVSKPGIIFILQKVDGMFQSSKIATYLYTNRAEIKVQHCGPFDVQFVVIGLI